MKTYKLYVKTHNITGLKYLGKTSAPDPHKYKGSGVYWVRHLKKHGNDHTTEILYTGTDHAELIRWGEHFSLLWDVVKSDQWANLKPESGDGGDMSMVPGWSEKQAANRYVRNKGEFNHSVESKEKIRAARQHQLIPLHTAVAREKISIALRGKKKPPISEETRIKLNMRPQCTSNISRLHSVEAREKSKETKRNNPKPGPNLGKSMTEETKAKIKATKALNKISKTSLN